MKLTKSTDFALRTLIYLSGNTGLVTMRTLSAQLAVPYDNLTKIVQKLAKCDIVHTEKGKYGGIKLCKPSHEITLREIIELIDGPTRLSECQDDPQKCGLSCKCKLKGVFGDLQSQINQLFESVTLKDVI
jgi:Rrf2 family nitric oxide-sensitive transcriptional repressor